MQDRDDKYQTEDEYHFSDDEVNYELDESSSAPSGEQPPAQGGGGIAKIAKSRLAISLVAFLGLMFVVYKMVSPTGSSDLSTDIGPQVAAPAVSNPVVSARPTQAAAPQQPVNAQQQLAQMQQAAQQPQQQAAAPQQPAQQQMQQPAMSSQQTVAAQQAYQQPSAPQQQPQQQTQQSENAQLAAIQAQAMKDLNALMHSNTASAQPAQMPQQPAVQQQMNQAAYPAAQQQYNPMQQVQQYPQQYQQQVAMTQEQAQKLALARQAGADHQRSVSESDMRAQQLIAENARLSQDMKANYEQRIAEYKNQTSNLQSEIKDLNTRVAGMESEMTQLIRTLTQQFQDGSAGSAQPAQERAAPAPKIPYSVQAIIPGRAWLRSNSGDTVTVTEGDQIDGVGQVTRIDPYGGVVEIDVRGRKISLSYGGGR